MLAPSPCLARIPKLVTATSTSLVAVPTAIDWLAPDSGSMMVRSFRFESSPVIELPALVQTGLPLPSLMPGSGPLPSVKLVDPKLSSWKSIVSPLAQPSLTDTVPRTRSRSSVTWATQQPHCSTASAVNWLSVTASVELAAGHVGDAQRARVVDAGDGEGDVRPVGRPRRR